MLRIPPLVCDHLDTLLPTPGITWPIISVSETLATFKRNIIEANIIQWKEHYGIYVGTKDKLISR